MVSGKQLVLKNAPVDAPVPELGKPNSTFELKSYELPELKDGELLLATQYISCDPAQRGWIQKGVKADRLYVDPVKEGDAMRTFAVCKVVQSKEPSVKEGSWVTGTTTWSDLFVINAKAVRPVDEIPGQNMSIYVGALGGPGLTAFWSLKDTLNLQEGETICVSGAAGATGSVVVQLAKHVFKAKKVVAIAGSKEKCDWLKTLGADEVVNYKLDSFSKDLAAATDGYVDTFWDGVGGSILNAMLPRIKRHGRVAAVGAISSYNDRSQSNYPNWFEVISNRITIKGMIVLDFLHRSGEAFPVLSKAVTNGTLKLEGGETIVPTSLEDVPSVWMKLFSGQNQGKLVAKL